MSDTGNKDLSAALGGISEEQLQSAVQSIASSPAFGKLLGEMQGKSDGTPMQLPPITPEMMAKLPQMMSALAPLVGSAKKADSDKKEEGRTNTADSEKRKKLLMALRPYLSDNRREAVDGILKMTEMTDLLGGLQLPGSRT
jgi:Sec-independent protein translocase protein TatA